MHLWKQKSTCRIRLQSQPTRGRVNNKEPNAAWVRLRTTDASNWQICAILKRERERKKKLQLTAIHICSRTCSLQLPPRKKKTKTKPDESSGMTAVPPPQTCCVSLQLLQTRRACVRACARDRQTDRGGQKDAPQVDRPPPTPR